MKQKLVEFIENNSLNFNTTGSGLNSACVIISGYALYLGAKNTESIKEAIGEVFPKSIGNFEKELERVFEYAENNSYGSYWKTTEANLIYKF